MKHLLKSTLSCFLLASLASCSLDGPEMTTEDNELVPVHFHLDFAGMSGCPTRSLAPGYTYSDGSSISILKGYVYNQGEGDNAVPIQVVDIDIKEVNDKKGGDITIMLPRNLTCDIVFLGTSIEQTSPSSKLYYNTTDRTLTVNYNMISGNDEEVDCFFASCAGVTSATIENDPIELTRPFAQLNVGTQDYSEYNAATPVKDIAVTVDGIYNKMNLMTGILVGDPITASTLAAPVPSDQAYPVDGFSYLSMNYLLVGTRKLVKVGLTVNHTNSETPAKTINIDNVAVERNYQTNVYGKALLTKELPTE